MVTAVGLLAAGLFGAGGSRRRRRRGREARGEEHARAAARRDLSLRGRPFPRPYGRVRAAGERVPEPRRASHLRRRRRRVGRRRPRALVDRSSRGGEGALRGDDAGLRGGRGVLSAGLRRGPASRRRGVLRAERRGRPRPRGLSARLCARTRAPCCGHGSPGRKGLRQIRSSTATVRSLFASPVFNVVRGSKSTTCASSRPTACAPPRAGRRRTRPDRARRLRRGNGS